MAGPRMTESVRRILAKSARANVSFRPNQWVYNRNTKEEGLVRRVYENDGITMYRVWLLAGTVSLAWGYVVSDWAEGVLESSKNVAAVGSFFPC